jgi:glutamine synthetase adenylyltransferase
VANVADLVLSERVPKDLRERVLRQAGFRDPAQAYTNLRRLAGEDDRRALFAQLAILAAELIGRQPDPDAILDRWRRQVDELSDPEAHFRELLQEPELLLKSAG